MDNELIESPAQASMTSGPYDVLLNTQTFDALARASKAFASSSLVPLHFQNKPHDIFVVLQMGMRLNVDAFTMLQSTYVVQGRPGLSATLIISLAGRSGIFAGPITYDQHGENDSLEVTAIATIKETGEQVSETVGMELAKAEGWSRNKKYQTMPAHMLKYRAATWLVRRYAPQVLLGMQTADELQDVAAAKAKPARASATTSGPNNKAQDSPSDRRRKQINAKIQELGLDRELVKAGMKILFGVGSTGECERLSDDEWRRIIDDLPSVAAAGESQEGSGNE